MNDEIARLTWPNGTWAVIHLDRSWTADSPETKQLAEMIPDPHLRIPGAPGIAEWAGELAVMLEASCEVVYEPDPIEEDATY